MEMNKRAVFVQWLIPIVILINTWSFLGGWVTLFARTWIWLAFGVVALIFVAPSFFKTKAFLAIVSYFIIVILNFILGDNYYQSWTDVFFEFLSLSFYGGVSYYLLNKSSEQVCNMILYSILFIIVFTSIATFIVDLANPDIVRIAATDYMSGRGASPYYRLGVCDYSMPHALPILIPPIVMWLKKKDLKTFVRLLVMALLLFVLLLVWTSGTTTPLLLAFFALVSSLFTSQRFSTKKNIRVLAVVSLLTFLLSSDTLQLNIIHYLEQVIPTDNSNYWKLQNFEDNIIYGAESAGDLTARKNLYEQSFTAFINSPILGVNDRNEIGGHSIILDRLAMFGIVGIAPYILFFIMMFRDMYCCTVSKKRIFIILGIFSFVAMVFLKNILGNWMYCTVLVFLPLMVNYEKSQKYIE